MPVVGRDEPVLASKPIDPIEFGEVAGDNHQSPASRMTGDLKIVGADGSALPFERGPDLGGVRRSVSVEGKHLEPRSETLDLAPVVFGPRRFLGSVQQLVENDRGDGKRIGVCIEPITQTNWPVA